MQITILISILLVTLIYLHIKRNPLIFQPEIVNVKILVIIALALSGLAIYIPAFSNDRDLIGWAFAISAVAWGTAVLAYWKFFAVCYGVAYFKKTDSIDPVCRAKVCEILLESYEKNKITPEYKMFLNVSHQDKLIESIRGECKTLYYVDGKFFEKESEKLKGIIEKLKNQL